MAKEKKELIVGVNGDLSDNFTTGQKAVLGLQNTLAMCGVILVPILCGLDVSVTLFCAGIGTIIYQFIDKKMVPAFLGGSFAIIAGVSTVVGEMGIPYAQGGILGMAVFYLLFALLLKILGKDRVARVFPPIIVGPIIMVLGLSLASVGVQEAEANWPIAIITFLIAVGVNNFSKGLTRVMTIIIALVGGFIISIPFGLVDFTALKEAAWIGVPSFTLPQFSWKAIALIAPCAIVPCRSTSVMLWRSAPSSARTLPTSPAWIARYSPAAFPPSFPAAWAAPPSPSTPRTPAFWLLPTCILPPSSASAPCGWPCSPSAPSSMPCAVPFRRQFWAA